MFWRLKERSLRAPNIKDMTEEENISYHDLVSTNYHYLFNITVFEIAHSSALCARCCGIIDWASACGTGIPYGHGFEP